MKKLIVIIAVIAMVGAFTATSMAAEWNFYGSSRMSTVYYDKSKEAVGGGALFDDQDMTWTNQSNTRIGAKVKASDAISGRFELAVFSGGTNTRLMYGEYNFGSGSLLVGQDYTPVDNILSSSIGALAYQITGFAAPQDGEGDALTIGSFYESRQPQIKLKFGDLELAFIRMSTNAPEGAGAAIYTDTDTTLPKVEVAYKFKTDMFYLKPYGGYNAVDFSNPLTDDSETVTSYVYGVAGKVNFGPLWVAANVYGSQNSGNFGTLNRRLADNAVMSATGNVEDSTTFGGQVIAGFKMSDMFGFEAGYSADSNEVDVTGGTAKNKPSHWYVNATLTLAPGVYIIPEVGYFDFGDLELPGGDTDQGDATYYGVEWKINF
jgi:hypothetical protein